MIFKYYKHKNLKTKLRRFCLEALNEAEQC